MGLRALFVILSLVATGLFIWWNYWWIARKNRTIDHKNQVRNRCIIYIGLILLSIIRQEDKLFLIIVFLLFDFFSFATLFPTLLNKLLKHDMAYTSKEDVKTDKLLRWIFSFCPPVFFYWCTFILSITLGYIFVIGSSNYHDLMNP